MLFVWLFSIIIVVNFEPRTIPDKKQVAVDKVRGYPGHTGSVFGLAISEDEKWMFSSGDDGIVAQWDLSAAEGEGEALLRVERSVYALYHISGYNWLAVGTSDGTVYLIDLEKKSVVHTYRQTTNAVYGFYFSQTKEQLWILQGNGFLGILDVKLLKVVSHRRLTENHLRSAVGYATQNQVYMGTSDHLILVLEAESGKVISHWKAHENSVFSLGVHPDNKYLLSGGRDAHLNVWDLARSHQLIKSLPAHHYTLNDIAFAPSMDYFMTASRDKTLKLWDAYSFALLKVIDWERNEGHRHSVNRIKWLKSDNSLISCSDDRQIIRWKIRFVN